MAALLTLSNQADRGSTPNSINIIDLNPQSPTHDTIINSIPVGQATLGRGRSSGQQQKQR
jgi:hypothetical protein